jgi:undecaprenyl-diphosphatase
MPVLQRWEGIVLLELLKVIVLGIVEGITEFLPISSTGHLIVATALLQPAFTGSVDSVFVVFIQFGAVVAVVLYYARDLLDQVRRLTTSAAVRRFWLHVAIAVVPAAVVGLAARGFIKEVLFSPLVVAIMLIAGGVLFIVVERLGFAAGATQEDIETVSLRQAVLIGCAQVVALIPGVSRSAASILGGMGVGLTRTAATRFSFYLAMPTLGAATLVDLLLSLDEITSGEEWLFLIVGAIVAGIVAWFAIDWLLKYVSRNSFVGFGVYRILAGGIILLLIAGNIL